MAQYAFVGWAQGAAGRGEEGHGQRASIPFGFPSSRPRARVPPRSMRGLQSKSRVTVTFALLSRLRTRPRAPR
eukprot:2247506-Lingulodinium_polyedra.AAC.1